MSTVAVVLWFGFGDHTATWAVLGLIIVAAALESLAGYCLGCKVFALLMKAGVIPERYAWSALTLSRRHRDLVAQPRATHSLSPAPLRARTRFQGPYWLRGTVLAFQGHPSRLSRDRTRFRGTGPPWTGTERATTGCRRRQARWGRAVLERLELEGD